jgi:hypothetical protein
MTSIVIDLPDDVVSQARAAGLLDSAQIGIIFQESLRIAARSKLIEQIQVSDSVAPELDASAQQLLIQQAKQAARKAH